MRAWLLEIAGGLVVGLALLGASAASTLVIGRVVGLPPPAQGAEVARREAGR